MQIEEFCAKSQYSFFGRYILQDQKGKRVPKDQSRCMFLRKSGYQQHPRVTNTATTNIGWQLPVEGISSLTLMQPGQRILQGQEAYTEIIRGSSFWPSRSSFLTHHHRDMQNLWEFQKVSVDGSLELYRPSFGE